MDRAAAVMEKNGRHVAAAGEAGAPVGGARRLGTDRRAAGGFLEDTHVTRTLAACTDRTDSAEAGRHLGAQIRDALEGTPPDALIVFASPQFDHEALLVAIDAECRPRLIVGASSAGEFIGRRAAQGTACALAIVSTELQMAAGVGLGVSRDHARGARELVSAFRGLGARDYPYRAALVMTDALAGHADELIEELTILTSGQYQFAGGGAGDDAKFSRTHVFCGTRAYTDAVVALEILSTKPIGIGVGHGWTPATAALRVTEAEGRRLVSLNGLPAGEVFEEHARRTGQRFDPDAPLPFFLHNILGIDTGAGYRLRVPLAVEEDGSVVCAAEIPAGAQVCIMKATAESAIAAAGRATEAAVRALGDARAGAALFFDCVATRLRMGDVFGFELESVADLLDGIELVGCNTYGQIARADGQFNGFHNCTAVVMVLPT
jgi:hypothetical protein